MKICPKCNNTHSKPGTYCCRSCANSRIFTEEVNVRRADTFRLWYSSLSESERAEYNAKKTSSESRKKFGATWKAKIDSLTWEELSHKRKKEKVLEEQGGCCLHCKLDTWLGQPMTFELDHIDGNGENNSRINMRVLCPNCHSQTPTWRKGHKNK